MNSDFSSVFKISADRHKSWGREVGGHENMEEHYDEGDDHVIEWVRGDG